jgi:hypothetical protein
MRRKRAIRNGIPRNTKEMFLLNRKGYRKESTAVQDYILQRAEENPVATSVQDAKSFVMDTEKWQ